MLRLSSRCLGSVTLLAAVLPAQDPRLERALSVGQVAIEKKDYTIAIETVLQADKKATDSRSRALLAACHRNRGRQHYDAEEYRAALRDYSAANRYTPGVEGILQSLGVLQYRLGAKVDAKRSMIRVLRINAANTTALSILGQLAAGLDDVKQASKYFGRAAKQAPDRRDYVRLAMKYGKEAEVESKFVTRQGGNFKVYFERGRTIGVEKAVKTVLADLEQAYRELTKSLGGRVSRKITVVVYNREQYDRVNSSHAWARAYYDGKLRIAVDGWPAGRDALRRDLRHELTHAFLHEVYPRTPLWVHEGLAQLIAGRTALSAAQQFRSGAFKRLPLSTFLGNFAASKVPQVVDSGYAQSLLLVGHLVDLGGYRRLRRLLAEFRRGVDVKRAVEIHYRRSIPTLLDRAFR